MNETATCVASRPHTQEVSSPMPPKYSTEQRIVAFFDKVEFTDSCWLWAAPDASLGYGQFWIGTRKVYAHRWIYEFCVGSIPDGLQIDHLCRVRHCVNPDHLEPVTVRENILRGEGLPARLARQTHCKWGHEFTEENTYRSSRHGCRNCRACHREWRNRALL